MFDALPLDTQEALKASEFMVKYDAKEQILRQEENSNDVFYILYGKVRIILYTHLGHKLSFTDIRAKQSFGELSAIDDLPRSANVVAVEDTALIRIPGETFKQLLLDHPDFSMHIMQQVTMLVRRLNQRMYELTSLDGKHRIYSELLRLAEQGDPLNNSGSIFVLNPPTHAEIASRVNSHREAVSRVYAALMKEGLLEKQSKKLILHNTHLLLERINAQLAT